MKKENAIFSIAIFAIVAWELGHLWQNTTSDNQAQNTGSGNADTGNSGIETTGNQENGTQPDNGQNPANAETTGESIISKIGAIMTGEIRNIFGTPYDDLINSSAKQYGIEPGVLYKLLYTESHFRPDIISGVVKSPTGALGIAQFMPATAVEELGSVSAALDPNQAIPGAARYLAKLIKQCGGDVAKGVASYNWGIGNVLHKGLAMAPQETINYVFVITGELIA